MSRPLSDKDFKTAESVDLSPSDLAEARAKGANRRKRAKTKPKRKAKGGGRPSGPSPSGMASSHHTAQSPSGTAENATIDVKSPSQSFRTQSKSPPTRSPQTAIPFKSTATATAPTKSPPNIFPKTVTKTPPKSADVKASTSLKGIIPPILLGAPSSLPTPESPATSSAQLKKQSPGESPWSLMPISDKDFENLPECKPDSIVNDAVYQRLAPRPAVDVGEEGKYEKLVESKQQLCKIPRRARNLPDSGEDTSVSVAEVKPTRNLREKYKDNAKRERGRKRRVRFHFRRLVTVSVAVLSVAYLVGFFVGLGIYAGARAEDERIEPHAHIDSVKPDE